MNASPKSKPPLKRLCEALVRDVSALKQDMRAYFLTLLTVIAAMCAALIASLLLIN